MDMKSTRIRWAHWQLGGDAGGSSSQQSGMLCMPAVDWGCQDLAVPSHKSNTLGNGRLPGKKENNININFWSGMFVTLMPRWSGVKVSPTAGAAGTQTSWRGRPRCFARTSMARRVLQKLCPENVCIDFLVPELGQGLLLAAHAS